MASKRRRSHADNYSSDSILFRNIFGILLIALGALTAVSVIGVLEGSVFEAVQTIIQGLGGTLCFGIPLFIIWGGFLVLISGYRHVSIRAITFLFLFYVFALGILNIIYKTSTQTLIEYFNTKTTGDFWAVLKASYQVAAVNGDFGGALGMLTAWPLVAYAGTVGGVIVLSLLCLLCLIFFSRFDFFGSLKQMNENRQERKDQKELEKRKQAHLKKLEQQQREEIARKNSLNYPAYKRNQAKQTSSPTPPPQPSQQAPVQQASRKKQHPNPQQRSNQHPQNPQNQQPASPPQMQHPSQTPPTKSNVTLYDEIIDPLSAGGSIEKPSPNSDAGRMLQRMDAIRKRKAQIAEQIGDESIASIPETPSVTISSTEEAKIQRPAPKDRYSAYKGPKKKNTIEIPFSGKRLDEPELVLPETKAETNHNEPVSTSAAYPYPMIELLNVKRFTPPVDTEQDRERIEKLEETLESFGIPSRVQRVTHGPVVTRFELGLTASGVNVKKILGIADTIALQLAANGGVRIEVPIPGTNLFGIEVPNIETHSVSLGEVLDSPEMRRSKGVLCVALGKDIAGRPVICDLEKMPHLLIAGQTGSGKSVCINTIINSLLYRKSPQELRMILIDPKVVELQGYNEIPHLLYPVVTDPHKAAGALAWTVQEMLDRYHKMQSKNVRNITAYNARRTGDEPLLPRIVVVIDELSDLMLACKREVEDSIIRLAQLARAAGIHVIIATQRPTVNVITGLIKANFPSRIAFAVASSVDSRTILDANGAEKLLGSGDMFYFPTGSSAPMRVQGCYVSDQEIRNVVDYIVRNSDTDYDESIQDAMEGKDNGASPLINGGSDSNLDEKLQEAIEMVLSDGQASISMLQRRMKVGYARAGRLIDEMASRGIVSQSAGPKPRDVLISYEQYLENKDSYLS